MEKENFFINKIFDNKWNPFIIISILGFFVYLRTLFFDFTYLDDNVLILDNQYFLSSLTNLFKSFSIDVFHLFGNSAFYYRPILTISFLFDYQIGGASPFIYHFTNIILHIVSSYLVFILLIKLNYKKTISFFFSIIFLVHPVLTQAVAWIPGRNDSLLAVFILLTSIFFIKYLNEEKISILFWSIFFLFLSIFTKESGIFIVPVLLFYLLFIYKEKFKEINFKKFYFFIASIFVIFVWAIARRVVIGDSSSLNLFEMIKSILMNLPASLQLIGKIFFPFNLSVLPIIQDTTFIYGIITIILLGIAIFFTKKKRWNYILFGAGWFFVFLLPSFIRPDITIIADFIQHRLYVPIIGFFIILLEIDFFKNINFKEKTTLFISGFVILIFIIITISFSGNFSDRTSFWKNAASNSPHYPLAHRNLGAMYYLDNDMDKAEKEFKIAIGLNQSEQMAHNNLGLIYANRKQYKEAEIEYKKELEINPNYENAYLNLGLLYFEQEKYKDAEFNWKKVLEINPNNTNALNYLMTYYYEQNNYQEASLYAGPLYKMGISIPFNLIKIIQLSLFR